MYIYLGHGNTDNGSFSIFSVKNKIEIYNLI